MMRSWKNTLGFQAVLAAAMFAASAPAEENAKKNTDNGGKDTTAEKLDQALERLKKLDTIETKQDELKKSLEGTVDALRKEVANLRTDLDLKVQDTKRDVNELKTRLSQVEGRLKEMEAHLGQMQQAPPRVSNFPPSPPTGTVRLRNNFNRLATVFVNGVAHRLLPGQVADLTLPAGPYTYWVAVDEFGTVQPETTGMLPANEGRTIEIYTR
jgi:septal ring factor EnvC (AmiA/AmiB activator)